ncbi:hypothetical protein CDL12_18633 [Handroanthus impetiginosus]|uniref:DOG1 domain-containing protein n=1 Tax=Handroanthus impetiginosus TaxID=429701 RepID=A0A2G9GU39_9LAMI|nr:hypothetical protein CDL12_18633 [Handroanthus impetiginosus]
MKLAPCASHAEATHIPTKNTPLQRGLTPHTPSGHSFPLTTHLFFLHSSITTYSKIMKTQVEQKFSDFYTKWMCQLEDLLQLLLMVSRDINSQGSSYETMVNRLTAHYKEYYTFKWAAAREDVLAFYTPVWLSPFEIGYLWVTGWKPSMAFRLVEAASMTDEQVRKIAALRVKIKMEEERVEREMERQQVAVADRKMVELATLERRAKRSGGTTAVTQVNGLVEAAVKGMLGGLEKVMKMADCVRLKTLKELLDILSPMQRVGFLASKSTLQIQMREWGKMREENLICGNNRGIFI